eukprot:jgi/Mesvir1/29317/Mv01574-RA.1
MAGQARTPAKVADAGPMLTSNFTSLILSQISTRIITLILNLLIARTLSPDDYGINSIQFHLINTVILFLSREGARRGCNRTTLSESSPPGDVSRLVNVTWLALLWGGVVATATCSLVIWYQGLGPNDVFTHAVVINGVAAMVELFGEPAYVVGQSLLCFRLRAAAEAAGTLTRCVITYVMLVTRTHPAVLVFSYAQLAFGVVTSACHWLYFIWSARLSKRESASVMSNPMLLFPSPFKSSSGAAPGGALWLDRPLAGLCTSFTLQAGVKLILAEGEKMVLVLLESKYNQGVYGLVSNQGSLVVRLLLQPFEESAFTLFSKSAGASPNDELRRSNVRLLATLTKAAFLMGLVFVGFGPSYSYVLLRILYGHKWSETEAPAVLAAYCLYVLALALNGITEAFVHAVLSARQLRLNNFAMMALSVVHLAACALLIGRMGATGLVLANCINMAVRVVGSSLYIHYYASSANAQGPSFVATAIPSSRVWLMLAAVIAATSWSRRWLLEPYKEAQFMLAAAMHVAVGGLCLLAFLLAVYPSHSLLFAIK